MKKLLIALGVSAAMVSGSAMAADQHLAAQGYTARIAFTTCKHNLGSGDLGTVDLTPTPAQQNDLNKQGHAGKLHPTELKFWDCPIAGSYDSSGKKVNSLIAYVDDKGLGALATNEGDGYLKNLDEDEANGAKGAFVRLYHDAATSDPVKFGKAYADVASLPGDIQYNDEANPITFTYYARLESKGSATSGVVAAAAPFVVEYE